MQITEENIFQKEGIAKAKILCFGSVFSMFSKGKINMI